MLFYAFVFLMVNVNIVTSLSYNVGPHTAKLHGHTVLVAYSMAIIFLQHYLCIFQNRSFGSDLENIINVHM